MRDGKREVTTAELLEASGASRASLYRWIERGLLPAASGRRGKEVLFPPEALTRAKKIRKFLDEGYTLAGVEKKLGNVSQE